MWCSCLSIENGYAQNTTESSLFQCQPTTDQSGQVFTPNIPDSYFNQVSAVELTQQGNLIRQSEKKGTIFVFTTPPEPTCSGTVMAFEFCYMTAGGQIGTTNRNVFRFVSLSRVGLQFTVVTDVDPVDVTIRTSPREDICSVLVEDGDNSQHICCDTSTLPAGEQFQIPSSNYTFGVVVRSSYRRLPLTKFRFPHFKARPIDDDNGPGDSFTLTEDNLQDEGSLLLLRLIIGM